MRKKMNHFINHLGMAMNHNMTKATVRPNFKMKTNYNLQEKLETKRLRWPIVNTHTINTIKIQCSWT